MEIRLQNGYDTYNFVDAKEGNVISIQSSGIKKVLSNLKDDYSPSYISHDQNYFVGNTVLNEIDLYCRSFDISVVEDVMNCLSLDLEFLNREINTLSYTEKIYLNIIRNIALSNNIVVFDDVFKYLDYANQKKIKLLLNYLKENLFVIFVTSKDIDVLYEISDYSIIWNKKVFKYDTTDNIYTNVEFLKKHRFKIPTLSYITYRAKVDKNVKLFYSKDVRDIIKDIYKHV